MNLKLSPAKCLQISNDCGATMSAVSVGQLLANPAYDLTGAAAAMSTTPVHLQQAIDKPEPVAYAPLSIHSA